LDAAYRYASNSVISKKEVRLQEARQAYEALMVAFPNGRYSTSAEVIRRKIETETAKISQNNG